MTAATASLPNASIPPETSSGLFSRMLVGKYRTIVLAVALFLVFDLGVLVLNFWISFSIADDAAAINLAGRQRMLSQRLTKALVTLDNESRSGNVDANALKEVRTTSLLFNNVLNAFTKGGVVEGGSGTRVEIERVTAPEARVLLDKAEREWSGFRTALAPLAEDATLSPETIRVAAAHARNNNLDLLALMNGFTSELETAARAKVNLLRWIQTAGILLALVNFAFILFKFLRQLDESDSIAAHAQRETDDILATVRDGLFLIDRDRRIGTRMSASLSRVLGMKIKPGDAFESVMIELAGRQNANIVGDYLGLLFGRRVKEALVAELNPVANVPVRGGRALAFNFNRVTQSGEESGEVTHVLVTVSDISEREALKVELANAKTQAQQDVEMLIGTLSSQPALLNSFVRETNQALTVANRYLRHPGTSHSELRNTIDAVFRLIHTVKGNAGATGLAMFEAEAQSFEQALNDLRGEGNLRAQDLMPLPLKIEGFFEKLSLIEGLIAKLRNDGVGMDMSDGMTTMLEAPLAKVGGSGIDSGGEFTIRLNEFVARIAQDEAKEARLSSSLAPLATINQETARHIRDVAVQLVRNAVVHGLEAAHVRKSLGKPAQGAVLLVLAQTDSGEYELRCRDDGAGLEPQKIRAALIESGHYQAAQLEDLSDAQVVMKIFEAGVSTRGGSPGVHAGAGMGLDIVAAKVRAIGGHLRLATRRNEFTEFSIRFPAGL